MTRDPLLGDLASTYVETLGAVLPPDRDVALVDFPSHSNVGDSAIWIGEVRALRRLDRRIRYACDLDTYDPGRLRRALGRGPVLIHGGGNLGDLYPRHQAFRERLLEDFPDRPVIQLPQSVSFDGEAGVDRARDAMAGHPRLTVLVRDRVSLDTARAGMGLDARLCPDAAFLLDGVPRTRPPTRTVLWLARRDDEADGRAGPPPGVDPVDWLDEPATALASAAFLLRRAVRERRRLARPAARWSSGLFGPLARCRLDRGIRLLSDGQVVVTDRLHGHILCLLLGIPHVVLDTARGKVHPFVETWTARSRLVRRASDADDALRQALALAEEHETVVHRS